VKQGAEVKGGISETLGSLLFGKRPKQRRGAWGEGEAREVGGAMKSAKPRLSERSAVFTDLKKEEQFTRSLRDRSSFSVEGRFNDITVLREEQERWKKSGKGFASGLKKRGKIA